MTRKSDVSETASAIAAGQAERLRRLRRLLTAYQADAGDAAGVSKDAWSRMEIGTTRVDCVALARFAAAYDVPAEYVVTGRLAGMREDLIRRVTMAEAAEAPEPPRFPPPAAGAAAASEDSEARKARAPRRSRAGGGKRGRPAKNRAPATAPEPIG